MKELAKSLSSVSNIHANRTSGAQKGEVAMMTASIVGCMALLGRSKEEPRLTARKGHGNQRRNTKKGVKGGEEREMREHVNEP